MIGIIVSAHGKLADALYDAASNVIKGATNVVTVGVEGNDDTARYEKRLREAVDQIQDDEGILLLTDMFGGTPSNVGMTLHEPNKIEVLTGTNLPMLIKAIQLTQASARQGSLTEIASAVRDAGSQAISVASEMLGTGTQQPSEKTSKSKSETKT